MTSLQAASAPYHSGFFRLVVAGTGLSATQTVDTRAQVGQWGLLADAIRQAIASARQQGRSQFAASDPVLSLPHGISASQVDDLWKSYVQDSLLETQTPVTLTGPSSLAEWSQLALALRREASALTSRLAPGAGGGLQYAQGLWFINGQAYTLSQSLLALKASEVSAFDLELSAQMSQLSANVNTARRVVGLIADLNLTYAKAGGNAGTFSAGTDVVNLLTHHGLTLSQMADWGETVVGGGAFAKLEVAYTGSGGSHVSAQDYASLIAETKSIFDGFNAENQVRQLRTDSLVNQRENLINGMSNFMRSQVGLTMDVAQRMKQS